MTVSWRPYGSTGTLFELGPDVTPADVFRGLEGVDGIEECIPGAQTVYVASSVLSRERLAALVEQVGPDGGRVHADPPATHEIGVIYDGDDLEDVAATVGLAVDEVVRLHTRATYRVAFLGFSRSFAYLTGLHPALVVPRLASPRTLVPAGSVGTAAGFTGIYPMASPGGWRLLGRTDAVLFDKERDPPNLLAIGDSVRFADTS